MPKAKANNPRFSMAFRKSPLKERFHKSYLINPENGCWKWIGALHTTGYGIIHENKRPYLAHRVSWSLYNGPTKLCVLHRCDNRRCVNPDHLFVGTRRINNKDRDDKGRKATGERHGQFIHGKYINQARWRTRPDGSKYFYGQHKRKNRVAI